MEIGQEQGGGGELDSGYITVRSRPEGRNEGEGVKNEDLVASIATTSSSSSFV
jgi:hypothetical protein